MLTVLSLKNVTVIGYRMENKPTLFNDG